jgi:hypothetical protein
MSVDEKKLDTASVTIETTDEDDRELLALGYKPSFKREFTNLATVCFSCFIEALVVADHHLLVPRSASPSVSWYGPLFRFRRRVPRTDDSCRDYAPVSRRLSTLLSSPVALPVYVVILPQAV